MGAMTKRTARAEPLSRERIVRTAVELLDTAGARKLTFRALTERLATGPGAIYWHVANKDELLAAATDAVVADAVSVEPGAGDSPREAIRSVALGLYEATEAHPWLAAQLAEQFARRPWGSVAPRVFEALGRQVRALGVPESGWFTATSALMHYVFGVAGQNAANTDMAADLPEGETRTEFLETASRAWEALDPEEYAFTRAVADQLRDHDDRQQFLAGVDLVLAGIEASVPGAASA
ncbi:MULTISPECIES: TetR/AcrR family transcriptional regulator [unclassified Streptomyces]|uniref:TetR/AcrR family transcriptional regulator n=2 Tax=Streptomyces TaxID=1883 RepID=UPI0001DED817|nr:TetR/AcrR family transcriptional regulator C-terminal domain-containing protein [Streptomyces sp. SPB78]EFK99448.1 TetR-family transcriptional regulator [Streptomyces sp. SPB78]